MKRGFSLVEVLLTLSLLLVLGGGFLLRFESLAPLMGSIFDSGSGAHRLVATLDNALNDTLTPAFWSPELFSVAGHEASFARRRARVTYEGGRLSLLSLAPLGVQVQTTAEVERGKWMTVTLNRSLSLQPGQQRWLCDDRGLVFYVPAGGRTLRLLPTGSGLLVKGSSLHRFVDQSLRHVGSTIRVDFGDGSGDQPYLRGVKEMKVTLEDRRLTLDLSGTWKRHRVWSW